MSISDEAFRDAFKPLHIPAHYQDSCTEQDKVVFALAQLGKGTADEVAAKLFELGTSKDKHQLKVAAASILNTLYDKGLIKGIDEGGYIQYNLSKITKANDGDVNPQLLAPGLD